MIGALFFAPLPAPAEHYREQRISDCCPGRCPEIFVKLKFGCKYLICLVSAEGLEPSTP